MTERMSSLSEAGNSALTDALYLDSLGAHVTIVHRRDAFRAEDRLQQSVFQRNMPVMWNTSVKEITGGPGAARG